jgi:hypothetical protein
MPKIETQFHWEPKGQTIAAERLRAEEEIVWEQLKAGDEIIVILEGFYIRDNKEWVGEAEVNIALQVATKNFTKDVTIGTFTNVKKRDELIKAPIVLLPPTKLEDILNIAVTAIELDTANGVFTKIPQIMEYVKKISEHVPIPAVPTAVKAVSEIVAAIVNIAGLINTDDTIIHNIASFVIDKEKYPGLHEDFYLKAGPLKIREEGDAEGERPTEIVLKVIKKKA